jgi:hypothetical protein
MTSGHDTSTQPLGNPVEAFDRVLPSRGARLCCETIDLGQRDCKGFANSGLYVFRLDQVEGNPELRREQWVGRVRHLCGEVEHLRGAGNVCLLGDPDSGWRPSVCCHDGADSER